MGIINAHKYYIFRIDKFAITLYLFCEKYLYVKIKCHDGLRNSLLLYRLLFFVVMPLLMVIIFSAFYLFKSLPADTGELAIQGIKASTVLSRDKQGVTHIHGSTDTDAFFALGYAHAQDRLWQLEVQKRTAQGRLSEIFGKESVSQDIWFRTLGLYQSASKSWDSLSPEAQTALQSYAAGINAWLESKPVLPLEFLLLDIEPELWHVHDSLAWIKVFALNLSDSYRQEITRFLATQMLTEEQLATVFHTYPSDAPVTVMDLSRKNKQYGRGLIQLLALQKSLEDELKIGGRFVGSNAWVVSAKYSEEGQTILANDPHLGLQIPSLWYAASLKGNRLDVSGMTLVGLPIVIFGRNQNIAWGGTAMMTDSQDLYFERINPDNPSHYLTNEGWKSFEVRQEKIGVRADFPSSLRAALKPVEIDVRTTIRGPVISDVVNVFSQPVSLEWTALSNQDTTFEGFYRLNYANNWNSFNAALSLHVSPNLNMLFSDKSGNIGYLGIGSIPIRKKGTGSVPVPGWNSDYGWSGFVSADEWPQVFNPSQGYIVNANNKVVDEHYPYFISHNWAPPARATRITQLLEEKIASGSAFSLADMGRIQADTLNLPAQKLIPVLTALTPQNEKQRQAINYLSKWNGDMRRDSNAASIFTVWMRFLRQSLFADELTGQWGKLQEKNLLTSVSNGVTLENIHFALTSSSDNWCDNILSQEIESCEFILLESLDESIRQLTKLQGSDLSEWSWGDIHGTAYHHLPFSRMKLLDEIFERKISNGGDNNTVNVSSSSFDQSEGYLQTFGAGFRQIIGLNGQQTKHLLMNSTGQSGNVLSSHYDDMVIPFRDVGFVSVNDKSNLGQRLTLVPALKVQ